MADIELTRPHGLPLAQARKIARQAADDLAREYQLANHWRGDTLSFERSGVNGRMEVTAREIALAIDLDFPLSLMKDMVESRVAGYIDERLAQAAGAAEAAEAAKATKPAKAADRKARRSA
jgi:putative polyhydroxyalkanoate system protein